eukprot:3110494-Lingulodinium_polyedra.AAC.1
MWRRPVIALRRRALDGEVNNKARRVLRIEWRAGRRRRSAVADHATAARPRRVAFVEPGGPQAEGGVS